MIDGVTPPFSAPWPVLAGAVIAWSGATIAVIRLLWRSPGPPPPLTGEWPRVSIVVPARNEENTLPLLLGSLKDLDYPSFEIIVVDDGSTDRTVDVASAFGVRVVPAPSRPAGWNPKNWACRSALPHASGEVLLFTDADTVHRRDSLREAVARLRAGRVDLMSGIAYHICRSFWERLMGPFHALIFVATAPSSPRPRRLYAVGQYLLFERTFYDRCGGHAAVASQYPDDFALANLCFEAGGRYRVHLGRPLFEVCLYPSFAEFVEGFRRNFQAGIRQSSSLAAVETTLVVAALLAGGRPGAGWITLFPVLIILATVAIRQRSWGRFSLWGVAFYPWALSVHLLATALALWDWARGGALRWKDRTLTGWTGKGVS